MFDFDPAEWAAEDLRAEFTPRRRVVYRCTDRMCGAGDCETCYGPGAGVEDEDEGEAELFLGSKTNQ